MFDILNYCVSRACEIAWGWPLILFFLLVGLLATWASNFVQFRYLFKSFKLVVAPQEEQKEEGAQMSPLQAFLNALSTSMGNGAVAGIATAIYDGGPGAAFWIFVMGFFTLPIRYCEVFLSKVFESNKDEALSVGPMRYLKKVPGGWFLPTFYAFFCLLLSLTSGNAAQSNSVRLSIQMVANVPTWIIASIVFLFMVYVFAGGAQRVIKISQGIVPFKVGLFFLSVMAIFAFHWASIIPAIKLILSKAFTFKAIKGAIVGKTMQEAIRFGMSRTINATESGLGVAGIFFGSTGGKEPVEDGILSMATVFISNFLVVFVVAFMIVLTGAWDSGLTSTPLTIAAYSTVFGYLGSYIVSALSVIFGMGVLIAYGFVGRECWVYLTAGRYILTYYTLYSFIALGGAIAGVDIIWNTVDLVNAGLLAINLYGILMLLPTVRRGIKTYRAKRA